MTVTAPQTKHEELASASWQGFRSGLWQNEINVRDFIQQNYEPYDGDESFLTPATARTENIWSKLQELFVEERRKGVLDVSQIPSSITAHPPGYIDRENEVIVGLQTDAPLKRAIMPNGGFPPGRVGPQGLRISSRIRHVVETFTKYRKTHNDAVFDAYTADVRRCRSSHILTGPARRLRSWPHHRRLSQGRSLRRQPAHRAQRRRETRSRCGHVDRRRSSAIARNWPNRSAR